MNGDLSEPFAPEYAKGEYSAQDAVAFCLASALAYRNGNAVGERARGWGFSRVEPFDVRRGGDVDTQGYVAADERRMLVAFRGTESLPDWVANVQVAKDPGPWRSTNVHEGFQDAFLPTALLIGKAIGELRREQEIWITGHSLGGALAVLLAATLLENGIPVEGLYTFAAPRVGDERFAERLNAALQGKAHWRVVNDGDLVPHLPSEWRFDHAGERRLLTDRGVTDDPGVWDDFKEAIWGWIGRMGRLAKLQIKEPHSLTDPQGYLPKLLAERDGGGNGGQG